MRRYLLAIILLLSFLLSGCGKREGEMTSQSANVVNFRAIYRKCSRGRAFRALQAIR